MLSAVVWHLLLPYVVVFHHLEQWNIHIFCIWQVLILCLFALTGNATDPLDQDGSNKSIYWLKIFICVCIFCDDSFDFVYYAGDIHFVYQQKKGLFKTMGSSQMLDHLLKMIQKQEYVRNAWFYSTFYWHARFK